MITASNAFLGTAAFLLNLTGNGYWYVDPGRKYVKKIGLGDPDQSRCVEDTELPTRAMKIRNCQL